MQRTISFCALLLVGTGAVSAQVVESPQAPRGVAVAVAQPVAKSQETEEEVAIDVQHGTPNELVDGVGWVLGIPTKLLLWDRRADNHDVSSGTVNDAAEVLALSEVDGVMIRVNQWDPAGEWKRLAKNERIGLGWRATVGAAYTIGYTLIPGRLVGGDWYNPFTDTVHVYSDVPALAMEQAAQAKDTHERSHPGLYSAVRLLPFVGLVHEARSKQAVYEHLEEHGTVEEQVEARKVLQPQMGMEVGGHAAMLVPQGDVVFAAGGAVIGHAVGRLQAAKIESGQQATAHTANATAGDHSLYD